MLYPKCGQETLYRDDDRAAGIQVIACIMCGYRIYGDPLRKTSDRHYKFKWNDENRVCECQICGNLFEASRSAREKYCPDCRPKHTKEYLKKYYQINRDKVIEYGRIYRQNKKMAKAAGE
jgi:predicted RNA-binding Zn-ribbon protein involved in translation (DUF1610 family)